MKLFKILLLMNSFIISQSKIRKVDNPTALILSLTSYNVLFTNFSSTVRNLESLDQNFVTLIERNDNSKFQYKFECSAAYPIEWIYEGEGLPLVVSYSRRILKNLHDFLNPEKYKFTATLFVGHEEQTTGNYICQNIHDSQKFYAAAYIFFQGENFFIVDTPQPSLVFKSNTLEGVLHPAHTFSFFLNKANIILEIEKNSMGLVTIPCAGSSFSSPDTIQLYKVIGKDTLVLLNLNDSLSFNPFLGFRLRSLTPWGDYVCKSRTTFTSIFLSIRPVKENPYLNLNVAEMSPASVKTTLEEIRKLNESVNTSESNDDDSAIVERIYFNCSTSYSKVHQQTVACHSVMDCNFRKVILQNSYIPFDTTVLNNEVIFSYPASRQTRIPIHGTHSKFIPVVPLSGIFYCSAGRLQLATLMFYRRKDNTINIVEDFPDANALVSDFLELRTLQRVLVGQEASFTCYGSTLFFSNGFVWKLELDDGQELYVRGDETIGVGDFIENVISVPISKKQKKMRALSCYAPLLNSSSQWMSSTLVVNGSSGCTFRITFIIYLIPITALINLK